MELFAHVALLIVASIALGYVLIKYALPVILPFLLAWGIAFMTRPPARFLHKKIKISEKISRPVLALILMSALLGGIGLGAYALLNEAWRFFSTLAEDGRMTEFIKRISDSFFGLFGTLGVGSELANKIFDALSGILASVLGKIAEVITAFASAVPKTLFFILITAISAVYFSLDLEIINSYVHRILPRKIDIALVSFKERTLGIALKYMRAYAAIMLLTFAIVFFGLALLGIDYALLLASIIAVLDILPVIGVGVILVPFGAVMLLSGNTYVGVGLLVLTAAVTVIRQIAEPKILGKNLGIHPLLTLILMYVGYSLFGIFGLVLLPLLGVVLVKKESSEVAKPRGIGGK